MEEFRVNFRILRLLANKSQKEMAAILHVSQATISNWEAGRSLPKVFSLVTIAKFFDVRVNYLLGLED